MQCPVCGGAVDKDWEGGRQAPAAVLVSGGLDSAILVAAAVRRPSAVQPLYLRQGLFWEETELLHLKAFLHAVDGPPLRPLHVLEMPVADLYGEHWSLSGRGVPDENSADEAVFLPGRNVLLLAKSLLWCHRNGYPTLEVGTLHGNPFTDATPAFYEAYQRVVGQAVGGSVHVCRPFARLSKVDVLRRSDGLRLEWTFSCIRPVGGRHCGRCNKCAERRHAFAAAGIPDPTAYEEQAGSAG